MENKSLEQRMETEPVHRVILSLAAPTVLSMLVISAYSIVDTFYVTRLGSRATLERKKKSRQSRLQIRQLCQGCCLDL